MDDQTQRIADLIRQGRKLEAIKLFREATGVDLQRAKDEVERIEANKRTGARNEPRLEMLATTSAVPEDILEIARSGNKIEAIKQLRERTGLGLKESKDLIDEATGDTGGGGKGCMGVLLLVASAGTVLAFIV
jgi:large subunit ribosomal protein L7/L12